MGDREFSMYPASEVTPLFRDSSGDLPQIGEFELMAEVIAILYWSMEGFRNIIMRTDNHNVMSWVSRARSNSPAPNRLIRHLCLA